MGQARARQREIADLKKHGRRMVTPFADTPVLIVYEQTWIMTNTEFAQAVADCRNRELTEAAMPGTIQEFARLALWAERSGVREDICQNWFHFQQRDLFERVRDQQQAKRGLPPLPRDH